MYHCNPLHTSRSSQHIAGGSTARGWAELRSATPRQLSEGPAVARHGRAMYRMEKQWNMYKMYENWENMRQNISKVIWQNDKSWTYREHLSQNGLKAFCTISQYFENTCVGPKSAHGQGGFCRCGLCNSASRHKELTEACSLLGPSVRASVDILWLRLRCQEKSGPGKSERTSLFKTCLQSSLADLPAVFDNTSVHMQLHWLSEINLLFLCRTFRASVRVEVFLSLLWAVRCIACWGMDVSSSKSSNWNHHSKPMFVQLTRIHCQGLLAKMTWCESRCIIHHTSVVSLRKDPVFADCEGFHSKGSQCSSEGSEGCCAPTTV